MSGVGENVSIGGDADVPSTIGGAIASVVLGSGSDDREQAFEAFFLDPKHGASNKPFANASALPEPDSPGQIARGYIRRADFNVDASSKFALNFMYNPETITRDYQSYLDQAALDPFNTIYNSGNLIAPPSFINFNFTLAFDRQIQQHAGSIPDGVLHDYQYFDIVVRNVPPLTADQPFVDNGVMMINPQQIVVYFSKDLVVRGRPTNSEVQFIKFSHTMVPTRMEIQLTLVISYFGPEAGLGSGTMEPAQPDNTYPALVPYDTYIDMPTEEEIRAASAAAEAAFQTVTSALKVATGLFLGLFGTVGLVISLFKGKAAEGNAGGIFDGAKAAAAGATSQPGKMNDETEVAKTFGGHGHIPMGSLMIGPFRITVAAAAVPAYAALASLFQKYNYPVRETGGGYVEKTIRNTNKLSMHAYGLAVDINQSKNPRLDENRHITDMPAAMTNEITHLKTNNGVFVFNWGGNWVHSQDTMHFQINAFAADLATGINMTSGKG